MSRYNQIESALKQQGDAAFQKLATAYLYKKGYTNMTSVGSVTGADKVRKGTPDAMIVLPNGKYAFAEFSTQQYGLHEKLKADLRKCFNKKKTGISRDKIKEVVLCFNSELQPSEIENLQQMCQEHRVNLNTFGVSRIAHDLLLQYPMLVKEYLGLELDTGQVLKLEEFISMYEKNALATPLSTAFYFRESELKAAVEALETNNVIVITGHPGVGKSRLALECCRTFSVHHPEYQSWGIFSKGAPDLYQDIRLHFTENGSYLILVDDANRLSQLDYILHLLHERTDSKSYKFVITVRDYALDKIRSVTEPYGGDVAVSIEGFTEEQIKTFVVQEFGIVNQLYLEQIVEIAGGNPRLAVMAAQVAKKENVLSSIYDVSSLYDRYFDSIHRDLQDLDNPSLMKTAGIVSFLRFLDFSNEPLVSSIEAAFGLPRQALVDAAVRLHELELVDMYESEVVKFTDQVLATYLFYLVFFRHRALRLSDLFEHFFPHLAEKFIDAINPVFNAFDYRKIEDILRPHVEHTWARLASAGDEKGLRQLIFLSWFMKETDTLLYVQERLPVAEDRPRDLLAVPSKAESNIPDDSLLKVMQVFRHESNEHLLRSALTLILDYAQRRPNEVGHILYLLKDSFGFVHRSYTTDFIVQQVVIDQLWQHAKRGHDVFFSRLFLEVAKRYLHTRFREHRSKGAKAIQLLDFQLPGTETLRKLRQRIWRMIFQLHEVPEYSGGVLELLEDYSSSGDEVSAPDIVGADAEEVLPFMATLDPCRYRCCALVQSYLDKLESLKIPYDVALRNRFMHKSLAILDVVMDRWIEQKDRGITWDELRKVKNERIRAFFVGYTFDDFRTFFNACAEITSAFEDGHSHYELGNGITEVLLALADENPQLYAAVIEYYITRVQPFQLATYALARKLQEIAGADVALSMLRTAAHHKHRWLFDLFDGLKIADVKIEYIDEIVALLHDAPAEELPRWDFLLKYRSFDQSVIIRALRLILEKAEEDGRFGNSLDLLFNPHTEANKLLVELFAQDISLLKKAYFKHLEIHQTADHGGETFERILEADAGFMKEYLDWMYITDEWPHRRSATKDFSFVWMRPDYATVMNSVIEYIFQKEVGEGSFYSNRLEAFFTVREQGKHNDLVVSRQDSVLNEIIRGRHSDINLMTFLFGTIIHLSQERQRQLLSTFLAHNKEFEHFKKLPIEPTSWSYVGSMVPMLEDRIKYFESLLPLLNNFELLKHRQRVEQHIAEMHGRMDWEKKRDFMAD